VSYYSHHGICNLHTGERVVKDLNFYFIELRKFHKQLNELENTMDKWIFFIKEASNLDIIPENLDDEGLREAYYDANKNRWTQTELDAYLYAGMREQDARGRVAVAEEKAREETKAELVIEMHKDGMAVEKIVKIAKISIEKVEQIIQNYLGTEG
jgi:predicted transposase/invertase (TIGR01784 family)